MCVGGSGFFPVILGVLQGYAFARSLSNICMACVLSKVVDQSRSRAFVGKIKVTDLVFAADTVLLTE